ncbi:hypothetical protein VOLCADRAFT_104237 [Volvox carteri f. nagariensis]|uniref:Uncharacterized protein n=1 Tax=Volvox carteri f. nagariensis TaxID=3068 RepID=D8TSA3_VOLCA|nr:uncharacterized protein VOLCADRAFT_104237 [Volvox carteri f. nagariensis]EFJ49657.1 hypothetical protein VOLCADRAFT_104237 [Volvox carteri f. nagariensis]|eukprot:XP_002949164.1 hypothetical protein VOLCADRAFT_104237 [Volvox carteri f. nagariensis]
MKHTHGNTVTYPVVYVNSGLGIGPYTRTGTERRRHAPPTPEVALRRSKCKMQSQQHGQAAPSPPRATSCTRAGHAPLQQLYSHQRSCGGPSQLWWPTQRAGPHLFFCVHPKAQKRQDESPQVGLPICIGH